MAILSGVALYNYVHNKRFKSAVKTNNQLHAEEFRLLARITSAQSNTEKKAYENQLNELICQNAKRYGSIARYIKQIEQHIRQLQRRKLHISEIHRNADAISYEMQQLEYSEHCLNTLVAYINTASAQNKLHIADKNIVAYAQ